MLTKEELNYFRTFGYAVIDIPADICSVDDLHVEAAGAVKRAYVEDPGGVLQLPAMSDLTPRSVDLLHNSSLHETVSALVGEGAIVKPAKITRFDGPTKWHRDCYLGLDGVKVAVYFSSPDDSPVKFDVIPASHRGSVRDYIDDLFNKFDKDDREERNPHRKLPDEIPTQTLILYPGQMLLFDLGLWHANLEHSKRLQWGTTFLRAPSNGAGVENTVSHLAEFLEYRKAYPKDEFPYIPPAWVDGRDPSFLAKAMRDSGVMDRYVARSASA